MISIQYLTYFMKICETHSMNKAADQLFISQPALSLSMKKLEEELGVTLFVRSNKGIEPTEDGENLLRHCLLLMKQMSLIENIAEKEPEQVLAVSAFPYIIHPEVFAAFLKRPECRDIRIEYEECRILQILDNVESTVSQLGIIQFHHSQQKVIEKKAEAYGLCIEKLAEASWAIVVGRESPFYERESVSADELKSHRLIRMKDDLFSFMTGELKIGGISMGTLPYDNIHSCTAAGYLLDRTDSYMFCALQDPFPDPAYQLHAVPVRDSDIRVTVAAVRRSRRRSSEAEETFLAILREHLSGYKTKL